MELSLADWGGGGGEKNHSAPRLSLMALDIIQ